VKFTPIVGFTVTFTESLAAIAAIVFLVGFLRLAVNTSLDSATSNTNTTCVYTDQNPIQASSYSEGYYGLTLGYSCSGFDYDTCVGSGIKKYLYIKDGLWYNDINAPEDVMSAKAIRNLVLKNISDFSLTLLAIVGICLVIGVGVLIFRNGWQFIQGTTMPDVARMGWNRVDKFFYKPWKGYKRYRSRKWNMEHID